MSVTFFAFPFFLLFLFTRFPPFSSVDVDTYDNYIIFLMFSRRIMAEYNDYVKRAERLGQARQALLNKESVEHIVQEEDIFIYLRWMTCHLNSLQTFNKFIKVGSLWYSLVFLLFYYPIDLK